MPNRIKGFWLSLSLVVYPAERSPCMTVKSLPMTVENGQVPVRSKR
ncbi:MAG: hypothetical protein V3T59_04785 [Desulfobacterales bacterium]